MNEVKHNQHENKYKTLLCECEIFFKKMKHLVLMEPLSALHCQTPD